MATWQERLKDACRFLEVAEAFSDPEYANQAASNAILAPIAANDAVCLYLIQERARGGSHAEATQLLQRACRGTRWARQAAAKSRQFLDVIRHKNAAQYEGRPLRASEVGKLMSQAQRFIEWARTVCPEE